MDSGLSSAVGNTYVPAVASSGSDCELETRASFVNTRCLRHWPLGSHKTRFIPNGQYGKTEYNMIVENGRSSSGRSWGGWTLCGDHQPRKEKTSPRLCPEIPVPAFQNGLLDTRSLTEQDQSFTTIRRLVGAYRGAGSSHRYPHTSVGSMTRRRSLADSPSGCDLLARTRAHVIDWQWCDQERKACRQ